MADSRSARPAPVVELVRSILGVIAIAVLVGTTLSVVAKGPPSAAATSLSWSNVTPPATSPPDVGGVTVYDPATDQLLLVQANGGTQTWAWNGTVWTSMAKMPNPDDEYVTTPMLIAYDSATSQLVLADDGTWVWGGTSWIEVTSAMPFSDPSTTNDPTASIAYDKATSQLIMVTGDPYATPPVSTGTWSWNGSTWTELSPATSPPARDSAALAYDDGDSSLVLFGGSANDQFLQDTWTWNGSDWSEVPTTTSPTARSNGEMAYDPATSQFLLYGGDGVAVGGLTDGWTFSGSNWAQLSPVTTPAPGISLAYDPATSQMVLYGYVLSSQNVASSKTWLWNGSDWSDATPPPTSPDGNAPLAMAYDSSTDQLIAVADGQTFSWSDGTWVDLAPAVEPPGSGSLAYDQATGQLIWFEQTTASTGTSSTWSWDGTDWHGLSPATSAPEIDGVAGFAYDPTSAVLVLVGPVATASGEEDQTWTFDGSTWSQLAPSESPPALSDPCLGYDPATGDLVLFGGFYNDVGSATAQAGTWAWDGTTWSESAPVTSPPGLADAAMAFDPQIGLLVMFGGVTGTIGDNVLSDQTWAWDGANWSQLAVPEHPAPRSFAGLAWDPSSSQMLLSGGGDNYVPGPADTWELGTAPIATPTITSVTAINSGASVTWTAPSLGAGVVIDSYTLTASPGGMSSSVAGDVTSGGVGGPLTNGVAYTITVTPVNQNGTYPSSAPSAPVVPLGAPGSATNVVATAGDQSVELTWTAPAPTSGAAPVSGYTISGAPSGPQTVGADTTSLDITGLTDGTGYLFAVETLSAFGDSEWDAVSQEVTPYGAVGAPTLISALAGSNHDVTVTWAPPAPVAGVAVGGYEVTTSAGGSITVGPTATSADVSGLLLEQIYYFRVFAIASTGTGPPSAWSPPLVLYDLPPGVPGSVRTTSGSGSLTVAWEAPPDGPSPPPGPPAGYIVELSNGASQRVNASATSVVFANLRNGVQYDVKVGAFNQYGYGLPSQLVDGTPYSSVGIPENVDATTEGRAVTLRWSRAARKDDGPVIGYEIRDSAGTTIRVGASEDSAKFSGLSPRSVYSFVVSALTEAGLGPPAETVTIRVPAVPPSAPRELSAADGNKWVRLSWVAPAQNGGDAIADYLITVSVCAPGKSPCEMKVVRTSTVSGTRSTATVGALTNGKRYYFSVAARTQAGESKASATVSARPTA